MSREEEVLFTKAGDALYAMVNLLDILPETTYADGKYKVLHIFSKINLKIEYNDVKMQLEYCSDVFLLLYI